MVRGAPELSADPAGSDPQGSGPDRRRLVLLVVLAAAIAAAGIGFAIARATNDDGEVAAEATTTIASTTTAPVSSTTTLRFGAPPAQELTPAPPAQAPTTTTSSAPPPTSSSTTSAPPVTVPPQRPRPGPTYESTAGGHEDLIAALQAARRRWADVERADGYVFRTQRRCFCPRTDNEITVGPDGTVMDQRTLAGDPEPDPPTIDDVFDRIEAAIVDDADRISVTFDRRDGFPIEFDIDPDDLVADDEVGREVSWLVVR